MSKDVCNGNPALDELQNQDQDYEEDYDWPIPNSDLLSEVSLDHPEYEQQTRVGELILEFQDRFDGSLGLTHFAKHKLG